MLVKGATGIFQSTFQSHVSMEKNVKVGAYFISISIAFLFDQSRGQKHRMVLCINGFEL